MRRSAKILTWTAAALVVLPVVIVAFAAVAANTDWGRRLIAATAAQWSGNRIAIAGLSGHVPDDLRVAHLELRDGGGPWLVADEVTLQWSPARLLRRELAIALLRSERVQLLRRPASTNGAPSSGPSGRVDLDRLELDRLDIGAPIAGASASLSVHGELHATSLDDVQTTLDAKRIDVPGSYALRARSDAKTVKADLSVDEPAQGLLSGLAGLPDLGAVSAQFSIDGPRSAEAARLALVAGALHAEGKGLIDLVGRTIDVDVLAEAPAMTPRADLAWNGLSLDAHVHGPFNGPDAEGVLRVDELAAGGGRVRSVRADVHGNRGAVALRAVLERLRVPGPNPSLFESAPVELRADVRLDDPTRPVSFALAHPLLALQGHASTAGELRGAATVTAPSLAPLASVAGIDLKGRASFTAELARRGEATDVRLAGTLAATGGAAPLPALLGNAAKIEIAASLRGDEIAVERAQVDGRTLRFSAQGRGTRDTLDFDWKLALSDLGALAASASGRLDARGRVEGPRANLRVSAEATGELGTHGFARAPVEASARFAGMPASPSGKIAASATLDGAPAELTVALARSRDGALRGTIERAEWKSVHAQGEIALARGARAPQGRVDLRIGQLSDLQPWIGEPVQGALSATVDLTEASGRTRSSIALEARNAAVRGAQVERLTVAGTVDEPTRAPIVALHVTADGIAGRGVTGRARLDLAGPQDALTVALSSELRHATQGPVPLEAQATIDVPARQVSLASLQAQYRGEPVRLLAPARFSLRDGIAVDRLRVGVEQAVLEVAGRMTPTLDVTASVRNVTPALAKTLDADVQAQGTLSLDARLTGTLEDPRGTVKVAGSGLRMRTGSARALPPASVTASAELEGHSARVDAKLSAGTQVRLEVSGRLPLSASGAIDMRTRGTFDATVANPILEVNGRRVKGAIAVDVAIAGSFATPDITGSLRVSDGELQDYALGAQLTKIDARLEASGDSVRIASFTARAGPGTVSASGTVGLFAPGRPVEIKVTARDAKPLATDLLTATLDAELTLRGESRTRLDAAGTVTIHRAEITIPKALPPTVAVLDVRRPGQAPPPPAAPGPVIGLDLEVDAPRAVFVRGRGLDAETGGALQVGGTTAAPRITGGFDMRRGSFDLGGATLKFTSGRVSFTGTGLSQKIDPTLDFLAETTYNDITARLTVTGYADAPRIALTSTPELPQDEILARLLFGVGAKQLTPLQLAQIANAIASLTGVGGGGFNPLTAMQKSLGLDRLSAGSTPTGATTVEAGRYVSDRVYVGAKQSTQGGTQAQVQVDLTKNLKLQATLGTGGTVPVQGATPENDPGSSIGLSYQFEY